MLIARAIQTILQAYVPLTALVSDRIYHARAAQQASKPYIVYNVSNVAPINRLPGRACADQVYTEYLVVSTDDDQVLQVATQLRNALDRVAPGTYAGVSLGRTMFNSTEGPQIDDEDDTFLVTMSYDTIINN